ncbi:hypothetical protein CRYUN_Cryun26dG0123600 [Craigia yunnanensis]
MRRQKACPVDQQRKEGGLDWRSNLYLVFVDNLSHRISRNTLWEAFCAYGRVVDVYISFKNRGSKDKAVTFAFFRYKYESELRKVIEAGNNKRIDGRFIKVKKATYGWKEKRKNAGFQGLVKESDVFPVAKRNLNTCRDNRSYRDVLVAMKLQEGEARGVRTWYHEILHMKLKSWFRLCL